MSSKLYTHPDFDEIDPYWQVYQDLTEGDHSVVTSGKYLWYHIIEKKPESEAKGAAEIRAVREERSRYTNYLRQGYRRYLSLLFENDPVPDDKVMDLLGEDELDDIDGEGNSLAAFIKHQVFADRYTYGWAYVFADNFGVSYANDSESVEAGSRPFLQVLNPRAVKDWSIEKKDNDRRGQFNFLRYEYNLLGPRLDPEDEPTVETWSKVLIYDGAYKVRWYKAISGGDNAASELRWEQQGDDVVVPKWDHIPISAITKQDSFVKDAIPEVLTTYNLESSLMNQLNHQAHQDKYVIGNLDKKERQANAEFITKFLPEGSTVAVIEPSNPVALRETIKEKKQSVFQALFNLSRILPVDSREVESHLTIQKAKEDLLKMIKTEINDLEKLMNDSIKDYAEFKNKTNFDGRIEFSDDVTIEDIEEELQVELAYLDAIKSHPTWYKNLLKKRAKAMNLEEMDEILAEIEERSTQVVETSGGSGVDRSLEQIFNRNLNGRATEQEAQNGPASSAGR